APHAARRVDPAGRRGPMGDIMRILTNTVAVLVATMFTIVGVYTGIEALGNTPAVSAAVSASATSTTSSDIQTCPRTSCTASSCHATGGRYKGMRTNSHATPRTY
ncbi:MAG: hypothetical protein ACYC6C_01020, partial [Coriobacteriia bacterium]